MKQKNKILSLILCFSIAVGLFAILPIASAGSYDFTSKKQYSESPYWEGDIVYGETVYLHKNSSGGIDDIKLLYPATEILSVKSYDLQTTYNIGTDVTLSNKQLSIPNGSKLISKALSATAYNKVMNWKTQWDGSIGNYPFMLTANSDLAEDGANAYNANVTKTQMLKHQIVVTYKHSGTWNGEYTKPVDQSSKVSNFINKLKNNQTVNIAYYGDSITAGWSASNADCYEVNSAMGNNSWGLPTWRELVSARLKKEYPNATINSFNLGHSGQNITQAESYFQSWFTLECPNPDIVFLAHGMNYSTISEKEWDNYVKSVISKIRALNANVTIVLVSPFAPHSYEDGHSSLASYGGWNTNIANAVSTAQSQVISVDVYGMFKQMSSKGSHKSFLDWTSNYFNHPNDFGIQVYSNALISSVLGINSGDTPVASSTTSTISSNSASSNSPISSSVVSTSSGSGSWDGITIPVCFTWYSGDTHPSEACKFTFKLDPAANDSSTSGGVWAAIQDVEFEVAFPAGAESVVVNVPWIKEAVADWCDFGPFIHGCAGGKNASIDSGDFSCSLNGSFVVQGASGNTLKGAVVYIGGWSTSYSENPNYVGPQNQGGSSSSAVSSQPAASSAASETVSTASVESQASGESSAEPQSSDVQSTESGSVVSTESQASGESSVEPQTSDITSIVTSTTSTVTSTTPTTSKVTPVVSNVTHSHTYKVYKKKAATYFAKGFTGDRFCDGCGSTIKGTYTAKKKIKNTVFSLKKAKGAFKVKYKKVKGSAGFQVQYKGKKKGKKLFYTYKSCTKTIKKLKKGTYKVRIRLFNDDDAKTNWTKYKNVKVK